MHYSLLVGQEKKNIFISNKNYMFFLNFQNIFKINATNFDFLCLCLEERRPSSFQICNTDLQSIFSLYTKKKIFHHQDGQALENIAQGGGGVPVPGCVLGVWIWCCTMWLSSLQVTVAVPRWMVGLDDFRGLFQA